MQEVEAEKPSEPSVSTSTPPAQQDEPMETEVEVPKSTVEEPQVQPEPEPAAPEPVPPKRSARQASKPTLKIVAKRTEVGFNELNISVAKTLSKFLLKSFQLFRSNEKLDCPLKSTEFW